MTASWNKTHYGWHAHHNGHDLTVSKYRAGSRRGFVYIARCDQSASTSPAQGHRSVKAAKLEAEKMADDKGV